MMEPGLARELTQLKLRLNRLLEAGAGSGDDGASFDVLLDLLDALDKAVAGPRGLRARLRHALAGRLAGGALDGVRLAREHALARLAAAGIEPVDCRGDFDPAVHQAIAREPGPGRHAQGAIAQVHREGWVRIRGGARQAIRPAQVTVWSAPEEG